MSLILPFTVYVIALYNNEDPGPTSEVWAVDCEAADLGFFQSLKDGVTANGQWEFGGYIIQKSETVFRSKPHKHFSSLGNLLENIGGIIVSWDVA